MTATAQRSLRPEGAGRLTISGVGYRFPPRKGQPSEDILASIDITAEPGQFVAIVGPSGCGKTTLLRLVAGLLDPRSGSINLDGRSIAQSRRQVGVVFQNDRLLPWRRVLDNVAVVLRARGQSGKQAVKRAREQLGIVGLSAAETLYPHQLSGGMRQRVNLARAFAVEPNLVLLDEPFAALDAQTRELMQAELLSIWQRTSSTVIMVTHQLDEAVFLADKVLVMGRNPGRVLRSIEVPFARPRSLAIKHEPAFHAITDEIWGLIEGSVMESLGRTVPGTGAEVSPQKLAHQSSKA
jgi:NitT/TauT family transport system ATP-binding protein